MVRKKISKKKVALILSFTSVVVLILLLYIWHQAESIRLGYQIGNLEERILSLKKDVERLEAQKASLLALERVEKIAREKLELADPKESQIKNASPHPDAIRKSDE